MGALKVGIREFREKLANYLLESDEPIAITRHNETVGYYIPTRKKATEADWESLNSAAKKLQEMVAEAGLTEDDVVRDFQQWRKNRKKRP